MAAKKAHNPPQTVTLEVSLHKRLLINCFYLMSQQNQL